MGSYKVKKEGEMGKRFFALVLLALCFSGCAGSSAFMRPTPVLLQPTPDKALVRFMRPSGYGFAINFNIMDGEKVIGNSVAKSQFGYLAEPGKHLFIATAENKVFLEAELEAGKTYYIITNVYIGAWRARVAFEAVTRGSGLWDKVKEYENTLVKIEPDKEALLKWETANRDKIKSLVSSYETKWKNKYTWEKLSPADGR